MPRCALAFVPCITALLVASAGRADQSANQLTIREVTSFKDGHALVLRSGDVAVDPNGDIVLTELPSAVLGTFWASTNGFSAKLRSVTVERQPIDTPVPIRTLEDLVQASVGRTVHFRTPNDPSALRTGVIERIGESAIAEDPDGREGPYLRRPSLPTPQPPLVYVREHDALAAIPLNQLLDVRFVGDGLPTTLTARVESERMVLDLEPHQGMTAGPTEPISLMTIQRGLRWIPSYRVTILDGAAEGRVLIELQATLINEFADLDHVVCHLAVGVPSFAFQATPDPMMLRESFDQLGLFFRNASDGQTASLLNRAAIMGQSSRMGEVVRQSEQTSLPSDVQGDSAEDLFIFSLPDISLRKGAHMVVPVTAFEAKASDLYRLDIPAAPPLHGQNNLNQSEQRAIAQAIENPSVRHLLRIENSHPNGYPITTAPALILSGTRVLAQGMLTYTPSGTAVDLDIGAAINVSVKTDEVEADRTANAMKWENLNLSRVDVRFTAKVVNRTGEAIHLEVRKLAFGTPDSATPDGRFDALSVFSADGAWATNDASWWRSYNWPAYWHRLNGAARFRWTLELSPGASQDLEAGWHYLWNS